MLQTSEEPQLTTKQKAVKYFRDNEVPGKIETALNTTFREDPDDVYGYLARYFGQFSKPSIVTRVTASKAWDKDGHPIVSNAIHCQVKGIEQACGVSTMPCLDGEAAFTEAATCINDFISRSIVGLNAGDQTCVDLHIRTAHEEFLAEQVRLKDLALKASECSSDADVVQTKSSKSKTKASKSPKHSAKSKVGERPVEAPASLHAMLLASQAVAAAAAAAANVPLCTHLRHLSSMQDTCGYYRPAPVVSVLSGGGKGKLSLLRDVMVIPSSSFTLQQAVDILMKLTLYLEATFGSKSGAVKNRWGVLMPSFDRIEQALDPLLEAFSQLQLEAGTDIFLGVALNVDSAYDQDKGKYDVAAGMQKSCEDMLAYYTDLRNKYPSIRLLVNPLAAQDCDHLQTLSDQIGDTCVIAYEGPISRETPVSDALTSHETRADALRETCTEAVLPGSAAGAACISLEAGGCVSSQMDGATLIREQGKLLMIKVTSHGALGFAADLALGADARMLYLPGLLSESSLAIVNRLLQLEGAAVVPLSMPPGGVFSPPAVDSTLLAGDTDAEHNAVVSGGI